MKAKTAIIALTLLLLVTTAAHAAGPLWIRISATELPLPEGARAVHSLLPEGGKARVASYALVMPLDEAVRFYDTFLKENGFVIIGGMGETGYNAAVKKGEAMFTLEIYPEGDHTVIKFIW